MPQKPAQRNGQNRQGWTDLLQGLARDEAVLIQGGGPENIGKQHEKGRLTARERIAELIDPGTEFFEIGLFAWMALTYFIFFPKPHLVPTEPGYWFMMQIGMVLGFFTSYPLNWWLTKAGWKDGMG